MDAQPPRPPSGDAASAPTVTPGKYAARAVVSLLQGQSNAFLMSEGSGGFTSVYAGLVKGLTGIPMHSAHYSTGGSGGLSIASGTPTFEFGGPTLWLNADAGDRNEPSTWPPGRIGLELEKFIKGRIVPAAPAGVPVIVIRFHSEYDSTHNGTMAQLYAAANRRFIGLVRGWIGKPVAEVPVFYGSPGFGNNTTREGTESIRTAWYGDARDPAMNAHFMFGSAGDCSSSDNAHMDNAGLYTASGRTAFAVARWLYDNGYAHTDLRWAPRLGPRVVAVRRVPGAPAALDLVVKHDEGTDLVVPGNPNLGIFTVSDGGTSRKVTSVVRVDAATLRITIDGALTGSDGQIAVEHNFSNGYYGAGRLVTDNWHTLTKPAWAEQLMAPYQTGILGDGKTTRPRIVFPLRRTVQPVVVGQPAADTADDKVP